MILAQTNKPRHIHTYMQIIANGIKRKCRPTKVARELSISIAHRRMVLIFFTARIIGGKLVTMSATVTHAACYHKTCQHHDKARHQSLRCSCNLIVSPQSFGTGLCIRFHLAAATSIAVTFKHSTHDTCPNKPRHTYTHT